MPNENGQPLNEDPESGAITPTPQPFIDNMASDTPNDTTANSLCDSAPAESRPPAWPKRLWRRFSPFAADILLHRKHSALIYCFAIPFLFTFLIHSIGGVFPVGPSSVLVLDLNAQYIYFFNALRDAVYGNGSLLYSFSRAMGGEFLGIYAYYLASPLSYIVCLFPRGNITEAIYFMMAVKAGLCGLTFGIFARHTLRCPDIPAIMLSVLYAFCGYATALQSNTMWIDALYLLPLIIMGLHALVDEKKTILYTLALTATLLFNYYIGYMTCLFVFCYFFLLVFARSRKERHLENEKAVFFRALGRIAISSAIAIMMAAVMIIPAYYSLTFGKDTFSTPKYEFRSLFQLLDLFSKLFIASYDTIRPSGLPFLYSGTITLFLVPFYFLSKKISAREKAAYLFSLLLFLFFASIKATDLVFHGFQAPNWMNCRYSFVFSFLFLSMSARFFAAHDEEESVSPKAILGTGIVLFLFVLSYFLLAEDKTKKILLLVLTTVLLAYYTYAFLYMKFRPYMRRVIAMITLAVVAVEVVASGALTLYFLDSDVVISRRKYYVNFGNRFNDVAAYIRENDPSPFYRTEKTVSRKMNDNYQLGIYGLSGSTSTLNRSQIDFLAVCGLTARSNYSQYCFPNPASDMLLGVKYIMADAKDVLSDGYAVRFAKYNGSLYTLGDTLTIVRNEDGVFMNGEGKSRKFASGTGVLVYENLHALPLGYCVSGNVNGLTFVQPEIDRDGKYILPDGVRYISVHEGDGRSACLRLNAIYSALMGREIELFTPLSHETKMTGVLTTGTYRLYEKTNKDSGKTVSERFDSIYYKPAKEGEDGKVTFTLTANKNGHIYMYIPAATYDETTFTVNGGEKDYYFSNFNYGILDIGNFSEGETVNVTFTITEKKTHMGRNVPYFFNMNEDVLDMLYRELSAGGLTLTSFADDCFAGTVTVDGEENVLFTTIPYDAGWKVTVDGEAVTTYRTLDACLGFDITPGTHTVTFTYFPDCYRTAILLTVIGTFSFIGYTTLTYTLRKKRRATNQK